MTEHLVPHIEGDMLGNPCIDIAFQHADQIRAKGNGKGKNNENDEQSHVPADQAIVNNPARKN